MGLAKADVVNVTETMRSQRIHLRSRAWAAPEAKMEHFGVAGASD
jgi:hypothetical protein